MNKVVRILINSTILAFLLLSILLGSTLRSAANGITFWAIFFQFIVTLILTGAILYVNRVNPLRLRIDVKRLAQMRLLLGGIGTCILMIALQFSNMLKIGEFINRYHPCEQRVGDSTYCYVGYDIGIFLGLASILAILVITVAAKTVSLQNRPK